MDGAAQVAAAGIANLNTGVPMTPDTAFLTGSITKVWTTTVVMTLVDQGKLDLDRPVRSYLPHFRVLDAKATEAITVRQLLNHSSGIDAGDHLLELGDGPIPVVRALHRQRHRHVHADHRPSDRTGGYGLGWGVAGRPGDTRLSHSGGSNGGIAQLVLFPERRFAFASFANSSSSYGFHAELQQAVLAAAGVAPAPRPAAAAPAALAGPPLDPTRVIGAYRRKSERTTIEVDGSRFMADVATIAEEFHGSESCNDGQARRFEVVASGASQLTSRDPVLLGQKMVYDFLEPRADGRFDLTYGAGRPARRAEPT
ncbi:MAG: serine hydrolase domain-containing protein [Gemmatimonadales bacterium]|nr:serine hydrolase domain-containing protein [Gemmatimonadales bacterium]